MSTNQNYKKSLEVVPHHKMGIKILHQEQLENLFPDYKSLLRRIEEHRTQIRGLRRLRGKMDEQYNLMYDNIFSIMGKRGSGKTSAVLTLKQLLQNENAWDITLPIIMPEMIPPECSMIGWILSLLEDTVTELDNASINKSENSNGYFDGCMNQPKNSLVREYNKVKELCYSQFYQVKGTESFTAAVINTEQQTQNSFNFSHELVKFWDRLVDAVRIAYEPPKDEEPLIYIMFDDVDLIPDAVISLLSTIVKYLSHPNLVIFVTADEELLYDVIENSMNKKLGKYDELQTYSSVMNYFTGGEESADEENIRKLKNQLSQKLKIVQEIPKLYGDKILPPSCRYYLQTFEKFEEKGMFIEQVIQDLNGGTERKITLEEFMTGEIDRYLQAIGVDQEKNFLKQNGKFIRAYLAFWGETSRQLANETLILKEFITRLIDIHEEFENQEYIANTENRYFKKLHYIMNLFVNNSLNAMGNMGMSTQEISELLEEMVVYRPEKWGIFFNYSHVKEMLENWIKGENSIDLAEAAHHAIIIIILMFFLENILIIETGSIAALSHQRRERVHGKGIIVEVFDEITSVNNSLVCKNQGNSLEDFLIFYEKIIDMPEVASNFNPLYARSARNYFQLLPTEAFYSNIDLKVCSRENPKWLKTITQILYFSYEGIYDIGKAQIPLRRLNEFSIKVHDSFYEDKLEEFKTDIVNIISSVYNWEIEKKENDKTDVYRIEDLLPKEAEDKINPIERYSSIKDISALEKELISKQALQENTEILDKILINNSHSTKIFLGFLEEICDKLIELYNQYDQYKVDTGKIKEEELEEKIERKFQFKITFSSQEKLWRKEKMDDCLQIMSESIMKKKLERDYNIRNSWPYMSISEELEDMEILYSKLCENISLHLGTDEAHERGIEIIKWNLVFKELQEYYLVSYLKDKKQSGDTRIDMNTLPYKTLYQNIKECMKSSRTDYLGQILRGYVREGSRQFVDTMWGV